MENVIVIMENMILLVVQGYQQVWAINFFNKFVSRSIYIFFLVSFKCLSDSDCSKTMCPVNVSTACYQNNCYCYTGAKTGK